MSIDTLSETSRALLEDFDDQSFCDLLVGFCEKDADAGDENPLRSLFEPWVLQRLKLISTRAYAVFCGSFLTPLRLKFPRQFWPHDLQGALQRTEIAESGQAGDVMPETYEHDMLALRRHGMPRGVHPGWASLEEYYTVVPGHLTVVTGVSGHMKSTFLQAMCLNLAQQHGWRFGMFSPENAPVALAQSLLIQQGAGAHIQQLTETEYFQWMAFVIYHFRQIHPPDEVAPTLAYLLAVARLQVERYQINGFVIDPWNTIDHQYGRQQETNYISECLSKILRFARHHQVHVWIVAHPTKMQKAQSGDYEGKYPPPKPYDISGSSHWFNKPDNCLTVWRDLDTDSPEVQIHVQKVKFRSAGRIGGCTLRYHNYRFEEMS